MTITQLENMVAENKNLIAELKENKGGYFTAETIAEEVARLEAELTAWNKQLEILNAPITERAMTNDKAITSLVKDFPAYEGEAHTFTTDIDYSDGLTIVNLNLYLDNEYMDSVEVATFSNQSDQAQSKAEQLAKGIERLAIKRGYDLHN